MPTSDLARVVLVRLVLLVATTVAVVAGTFAAHRTGGPKTLVALGFGASVLLVMFAIGYGAKYVRTLLLLRGQQWHRAEATVIPARPIDDTWDVIAIDATSRRLTPVGQASVLNLPAGPVTLQLAAPPGSRVTVVRLAGTNRYGIYGG